MINSSTCETQGFNRSTCRYYSEKNRGSTITANLTAVAPYACISNSKLQQVVLPTSVALIGYYAFSNDTALTSVTASPVTIDSHAFEGCTALTTFNWGSTTLPKSIEYMAFSDCTSLGSFTLPASLTVISSRAFVGSGIVSFVMNGSGVYKVTEGCIMSDGGKTLYVSPPARSWLYNTLPKGITAIGDYAFLRSKAQRLLLPYGVKSIGIGAFRECKSLTTIRIPSSVTSFKADLLYQCTALENLYFNHETPPPSTRTSSIVCLPHATFMFRPMATM